MSLSERRAVGEPNRVASSETREPGRTLLLYCPYDRKVTRHARRGSDLRLVCLDCGRGPEPEPAKETSPERRRAAPRARAATSPRLPEDEAAPAEPTVVTRGPPSRGRRTRVPPDPPREPAVKPVRRRPVHLRLPRVLIVVGALLALLAVANVAVSLVGRDQPHLLVAGEAPMSVGHVANTDGIGVYLRRSPAMDDLLHAVPEGTTLKLVGAEERRNGVVWRQVEDPTGVRGWVPAQYVRIEQGTR